ncbi:short-chain dehydrogenase/reductase SDR [Paenibacillus mucilaginosus 3016]|uniref:Short-chain dehydrogenase/reductase SDR n=1 Tax=Paenibacillus mucilaginosus 3016 TaxID=1116391 RepID=H6NTU9_9BACL|nr:short-chain dehydrogenase/reductase SDR [Paenibacillus mucilaginosus 3016]
MSGQRVKGRAAVVTGGASGIGRASALRLAEHGAKVCLLDRSVEEAEEVRQAIERAGGEAMVVECDVSRPEQIQAGIEQAAARWGRLDIVFANAGVNGTVAPIETMETGDWDETIAINLRGTFAAVKYAIPHLKEGGGSIVITSSINGNRVFSGFGFGAYSTTKAGQVAFMKMAALELAQFKIRVNAVCPEPSRRISAAIPIRCRSLRRSGFRSSFRRAGSRSKAARAGRSRWPISSCSWLRTNPAILPGRPFILTSPNLCCTARGKESMLRNGRAGLSFFVLRRDRLFYPLLWILLCWTGCEEDLAARSFFSAFPSASFS